MENRVEIERSRSLARDDIRAIERRVDGLGAVRIPFELGWLRRDLRQLVLELSRWRTALDRLIGVQDMKLRLVRQACEHAAPPERQDLEVKLLLTQERYAALQDVRFELLGAVLPPKDGIRS